MENVLKKTFIRSINEHHIRDDFLKNYLDKTAQNRQLSKQDLKFLDILKTPSVESESL